jgi:hypothetical protein
MIKKPGVVFIFVVLISSILMGEETFEDYQVKSSIIYKICMFTQWPQTPDPDKPFIISVLGELPPGSAFTFPKNTTIQKRKIVIREIKTLEEIDNSDVLFIASTEEYRLGAILEYVEGKPILTVGDTRGFCQRGVIVNFTINYKKQRPLFEINPGAAKKASLQMNSQLFTIGRVIGRVKSMKNGAQTDGGGK